MCELTATPGHALSNFTTTVYLPINSEFLPLQPALARNNYGGHLWANNGTHAWRLLSLLTLSAVYRCGVMRINNDTQTEKRKRRKPQFKKAGDLHRICYDADRVIHLLRFTHTPRASHACKTTNGQTGMHQPASANMNNASWDLRSN
jgi:hypothetical protein